MKRLLPILDLMIDTYSGAWNGTNGISLEAWLNHHEGQLIATRKIRDIVEGFIRADNGEPEIIKKGKKK